MKNIPSIFYKELIWSQPQSKSDIDVDRKRKIAPSFFFDFREHVLKQFNIDYETNKILNCQSLRLFFLGRRNYVAHPRNPSGKISRQLANENQTLNDLKMKFSSYPHVNFTFNYFEQLSIEEQLKTIIQTDIFIGMHGAGLTHVIFLNSKRALVELASPSWLSQQHFELMASMNTITYRRCSISDGSPTTAQTIFECTKEMISQMCPLMTAISANSNPIVRTISTGVENTSNSSTSIKR
jgi:glycoprotein 2-beta-D-xylosyltransferase